MTTTTTAAPPASETPRFLQRIDLRTALIVAGVCNAILGTAFAVAGWIVISIAAQRGFLEQINSAAADLSSDKPLHLSAFRLCLVWFLIVVGWSVAMTIVAGLVTIIFNTVLHTCGGVELSLTDERGKTPEVREQASRAGRWVTDATTTAARAAGRAGRKMRERLPEPVLRFDAGSRFRGLLETGATPGRAPARTSAPAADAREAVESQAERATSDQSGFSNQRSA